MRLTDADVMIEYLRKLLCDNCSEKKDWCDVCDYAYLIDEMKKVPTVDPIKHGHWMDEQRGRWIYARCGLCGTVHNTKTNYCPNCGADMRGGR